MLTRTTWCWLSVEKTKKICQKKSKKNLNSTKKLKKNEMNCKKRQKLCKEKVKKFCG